MPSAASDLRRLSPAERAGSITRAAQALRDGGVVVLPTETVYGLAAAATIRSALDRLAEFAGQRLREDQGAKPLAWHAHGQGPIFDALPLGHPVHKRLVRRLTPGPVTFVLELAADEAVRVRRNLGALEGAIVGLNTAVFRVPDHPIAQATLEEAGVPVVAEGISAAGWGAGSRLPERITSAEFPVLDAVLDDGPTRLSKPSTLVRLTAAGGYRVERVGAVEERFIDRQLERTILFVCSGNTCRSPMAAAIARHILAGAGQESPIRTRVRSAGTFTSGGQGATAESVDALRRLGIDMDRHVSAEVTRDMIHEADIVFTMTPEHRQAILPMIGGEPSPLAAKVQTLDPTGAPVPDPIGQGQDVYDTTAARLRELIGRRLQELDL